MLTKKGILGPEHYEIQIKVKGTASEENLIKLGAQRISVTEENDRYYSTTGLFKYPIHRIRDQNGKKSITIRYNIYKELVTKKITRAYYTTENGIKEYIKKNNLKLIGIVLKTRTRYRLGKIDICIDDVQGLGKYTEIQSNSPLKISEWSDFLKTIGLDLNNVKRQTYLGLIYNKQKSKILLWLLNIAEKMQDFSFGITSGVMTTIGMIIGLWFGSEQRIAVISGIFAVAFTDSFSDAMGIYSDEKLREKGNEKKAIKKAIVTFIVKALMSLTFVVPFFIFSGKSEIFIVGIDILWAILVICLFGLQIAAVEYSSPAKTMLKQLFIATIIGILAFGGGRLVNLIMAHFK